MRSNIICCTGLVIAMLVGCNEDKSSDEDSGTGTKAAVPTVSTTPATAAGNAFPAAKATAGVTGTITFEGAAPSAKKLNLGDDIICAAHNKTNPIPDESLVLSANKGIRDVVVYVKKFPTKWDFKTPSESVNIEQAGCRYSPHTVTLMKKQRLAVTNKDKTSHNVHIMVKYNKVKKVNFSQAFGKKDTIVFKRPEMGAYLKCDIHSWMKTYVCVFDHPFHAVTSTDGTFDLGKLPAGTYEIATWHPLLGKQSQTVELKDGAAATVNVTLKLK